MTDLVHYCAEVEFVDSPSSYYYLLRGTLVVIPCLALQVVPNSNQLTLNATFFRNSTPINVYDPPPLHFVHVDSFENVIGLGVFAAGQDNHTTYHCMAGGITSTQTRIFVGGELSSLLHISCNCLTRCSYVLHNIKAMATG